MSEFFNDNGVPHSGFIAAFAVAGNLKVENFNPDNPGKVILRPDQIGSPNGWVGVTDQMTATASVQIPTSAGSALDLGDYFVAAAALHSFKWVVTRVGDRYQMGDYWKQEVSFHRAYFN